MMNFGISEPVIISLTMIGVKMIEGQEIKMTSTHCLHCTEYCIACCVNDTQYQLPISLSQTKPK